MELLAAGRSKGQLQAAIHSPQPCARPTSAAASPDNILNSPHSLSQSPIGTQIWMKKGQKRDPQQQIYGFKTTIYETPPSAAVSPDQIPNSPHSLTPTTFICWSVYSRCTWHDLTICPESSFLSLLPWTAYISLIDYIVNCCFQFGPPRLCSQRVTQGAKYQRQWKKTFEGGRVLNIFLVVYIS